MTCGGKCECADCSTATMPEAGAFTVARHPSRGTVARSNGGRRVDRGSNGSRPLRPEGSSWGGESGLQSRPFVPGGRDDFAGLTPPQALERRLSREERDEERAAWRGPLFSASPADAATQAEVLPASEPPATEPEEATPTEAAPRRSAAPPPFTLQPPGTSFGFGEFGPTSNRGKGGGGGAKDDPKPEGEKKKDGKAKKAGKPDKPPFDFAAQVANADPSNALAPSQSLCDCDCVCGPAPSTMLSLSVMPQFGTAGANFLQPPYFVQQSALAGAQSMAVMIASGSVGSDAASPGQFSGESLSILRVSNSQASPLANVAAGLFGVAGFQHATATSANPTSYAGNPSAMPGNALVAAATSGQSLTAQVARAAAGAGLQTAHIAPGSQAGSGVTDAAVSSVAKGSVGGVRVDTMVGSSFELLRSLGGGGERGASASSLRGDPNAGPGASGGDGTLPKLREPTDPVPPPPPPPAKETQRERDARERAEREAEKKRKAEQRAKEKTDKQVRDADREHLIKTGGAGGGKVLELLPDPQRGGVTPNQPGSSRTRTSPIAPPLHPGGGVPGTLAMPAGTLSHLGAGPGWGNGTASW